MKARTLIGTPLMLAGYAVIALFLLLGSLPIDHQHNHDFGARLMDAGHFPLMLVLMLIFATRGRLSLLPSAVVLLAVAGLIEIVQPYFSRSESFTDFSNGLLGISAGSVLVLGIRSGAGFRFFAAWALSSTLIFGLLLLPAYHELRAIAWRERNFPLLASFENTDELRLWPQQKDVKRSFSAELQTEGSQALHVVGENSHFPSVEYLAGDRDWSGYKTFAFDIYLPEQRWNLHLRIDDSGDCSEFGNRFNRMVELRSGWNHLELPIPLIESQPKNRKLDIANVRRVIFFSMEPLRDGFYLDNLRLIPESVQQTRSPAEFSG